MEGQEVMNNAIDNTTDRGKLSRPVGGPVLVCYDGSTEAEHGLSVVLELLGAHEVVLLTIWQSLETKLAESGSFGSLVEHGSDPHEGTGTDEREYDAAVEVST